MALHQKTAGNIDFHCDIKLESDWFTCYLVRVFNVNKHLTLTVLLERGIDCLVLFNMVLPCSFHSFLLTVFLDVYYIVI